MRGERIMTWHPSIYDAYVNDESLRYTRAIKLFLYVWALVHLLSQKKFSLIFLTPACMWCLFFSGFLWGKSFSSFDCLDLLRENALYFLMTEQLPYLHIIFSVAMLASSSRLIGMYSGGWGKSPRGKLLESRNFWATLTSKPLKSCWREMG
jgi:hypothetical protein